MPVPAGLIAIFISSFLVAFSGAMMPGPLLTATITESLRRGFIAGPLMVAGHAVLELALIIALVSGLGPFLQQRLVFSAIAFSGSIILLWLAYGMFRSLPHLSLSQAEGSNSGRTPFVSGILMSLSNPYWIIWWATIGLWYILSSMKFGMPGIIFFFTGHILADLAWYSFISAAVSEGRGLLSDRLYRGIIVFCAFFLVIFALYFAFSGFSRLG